MARPSGPYGAGRRNPRVRPATKLPSSRGAGKKPPQDCCAMVAAARAVRQGRFRLARRYAILGVRLIATR